MKKCLFLFTLLLFSIVASSQKKELKAKFDNYTLNNAYIIDGNNIVVSRVIDNLSENKDDIYLKVRSFFARTYTDSKSVIQVDDKEAGTIIGKGYYKNIYFDNNIIISTMISAYHILRVDIKDNKVRVICSASDWEINLGSGKDESHASHAILDMFPFGKDRFTSKNNLLESTIRLIDLMNETIDSIEKSVKDGSLSIEGDEW